MSDILVSVRMPASLVEALKQASREDHFMDASELIRSVLREQWLRAQDPATYEITKLRVEINQQLKDTIAKRTQKGILDELNNIKRGIGDA